MAKIPIAPPTRTEELALFRHAIVGDLLSSDFVGGRCRPSWSNGQSVVSDLRAPARPAPTTGRRSSAGCCRRATAFRRCYPHRESGASAWASTLRHAMFRVVVDRFRLSGPHHSHV
jgi:hypothetical protein